MSVSGSISAHKRKDTEATIDPFANAFEAGLGHDAKANTYKVGTEKAYHHLNRSLDYFSTALGYKPNNARALLARAKVLIQLATSYQPPRTATISLQDCVKSLRKLVTIAPNSVSARETLAQACALLSSILLEHDDLADDEIKTWQGQVGILAREALQHIEDVAADKMDRMRAMRQDEAAQQAPAMAETFIALSSAAVTVSTLATDLETVEVHVELAEQALDQASNMATVSAAARVKSSNASANLITRVQLASGISSLERLRHTFVLGTDLDEDDFRSLTADMTMLADECRARASKLKGSKGATAATLAWESIQQLGDAKVLYADLLRLVWRKRRPVSKIGNGNGSGGSNAGSTGSRSNGSFGSRKLSSRADSMEATIEEEDEDEKPEIKTAFRPPFKSYHSGSSAASEADEVTRSLAALPLLGKSDPHVDPHHAGPLSPSYHRKVSSNSSRKSSGLGGISENEEVSSFAPVPMASRISSQLASGRRGSWLPEQTPGPRTRRQSSMSSPLVGPDGVSAWSRKASVISLSAEDEAQGLVPSSALAKTAWQLLDSAVKQYKLGLSILNSADLPAAQLAKAKTDTLNAISYASLFMASLSRRVAEAHEKRTALLVTSEVYSTWGAREVGWSFLIEGTKEAAAADRRTNSWRADEAGKRAVMLLLRTWWHRAVTTENVDVDTKAAARDAVEVVVRRMRDREGVKDGDVARFKGWLIKQEGELDPAEALFWRSVSRILRGGAGFVMS